MKTLKSNILQTFILVSLLLFSCSDGGGGEQPPIPPEEESNPPAKATGVLPANGEPCSDFEEVAGNDTEVLVAFQWNTAQLAETYLLIVLEGSTEVFRNSFTTTATQVQLERGKTYTWRVVTVNDDGETNGDTFSFTTPGIPVGNFAPYAAEISVEFDMALSEMTISWTGSDEDGDTLIYDVKVFEESELIEEFTELTSNALNPIAISATTDYEVEVISKDEFGNFSVSNLSVISPNN